MTGRVIIEAAINGGTPKARNASVPRTPGEVAADALRCFEAGAAIVHNHTDDPVIGGNGRHDAQPYLEAWRPVLAQRPDALLYPTMAGGGPHTNAEERYQHIVRLAGDNVLRIGLVDPGSTNVGAGVYENDPAYVRYTMDRCRELRLGPSLSIFEPGFLRAVLAYHRAGALPQGALVKLYFGGPTSPFGLPASEASLNAYLEMLESSAAMCSRAASRDWR
ncbi:3-keto-5-aminohexanoate cleavage protein [bacterium]|nr:3-keto-5-aminohexanoate cleavage protein [bacterium]